MQSHKCAAVILAAGQGTRMKSALPKVLHEIAGRPLVAWPVEQARLLGCEKIAVVVGHVKYYGIPRYERTHSGA